MECSLVELIGGLDQQSAAEINRPGLGCLKVR